MALLQSCCCWHSLRKGSYASAVYTMTYFGVTLLIMAVFVHEERQVLAGQDNNTEPYDSTILEADTITPTTMVFNVMVIMCSVVGLASCPPLVYGIYTDRRQLLVPWIVAVVIGSVVDVAHVVYLIYIELRNFNPMTAIVFTLDFFLISFNIYSLLCVVSQYQEYRAGRGKAHQTRFPGAKVRYTSKPDRWPEGRGGGGRVRGLSLVPTPTGGPNGPLIGVEQPAPRSPCQADGAQSHSPRNLSPCSGSAWPGGGGGGGGGLLDAEVGGAFSRSPSVRKHVQFNQAEVGAPALGALAGAGAGALGPPGCHREASFKGQLPGRRRSAIQRAPLPEESSLELAEGTSADAEVEVVELLAPPPPALRRLSVPALVPAPAPASHSATGAWLVPRPGPPGPQGHQGPQGRQGPKLHAGNGLPS